MPEFKHNFTGGKMNKDVDERLVPKGEYRHAMNIQVSTSEGNDVGTVQNILGNLIVEGGTQSSILAFATNKTYTCVGAIADEKNDTFYWFVNESAEEGFTVRDLILQYTNGGSLVPVLVDKTGVTVAGSNSMFAQAAGGLTSIFLDTTDTDFASLIPGMFVTTVYGDQMLDDRFISLPISGEIISVNVSTGEIVIEFGYQDMLDQVFDGVIDVFDFYVNVSSAAGQGVLNFNKDNIITGINIIDNMLFWTDGETEPKKINIPRSIEGTNATGHESTRLINKALDIDYNSDILLQEEHITVIRKAPLKPPSLKLSQSKRDGVAGGKFRISNNTSTNPPFYDKTVGDTTWLKINSTTYGGEHPDVRVGDFLRLSEDVTDIPDNYTIRVSVIQKEPGPFTATVADGIAAGQASTCYLVKIQSINNDLLSASDINGLVYWRGMIEDEEYLFKRKFPRFAYRYKYIDNEYSSFGPFSDVAFIGGEFAYKGIKAYNTGMINKLKSLYIKDFVPSNIPLDVVQVDILYKNETSPTIYLLNSISPKDKPNPGEEFNEWYSKGSTSHDGADTGSYEVSTETIFAALPAPQSLRTWDNVPKTALAQEITGNRVIYGNYKQGYNMKSYENDDMILKPNIVTTLSYRDIEQGVQIANKSIKSLRSYDIGVVWGDKYGRETPVTSSQGSIIIPKTESVNSNYLTTSLNESPYWADYYRFYIKETSNEYYNLPVDKVYDADDGNVWVSFPSIDRNKIDEDTYIVLKKGIDSDELIMEEAKYKVVAIENEAPEYIKTSFERLVRSNTDGTKPEHSCNLYGGSISGGICDLPDAGKNAPRPGYKSFSIDKSNWSGDYSTANFNMGLASPVKLFEEVSANATTDELFVSFSQEPDGGATVRSEKYHVVGVEEEGTSDAYYSIKLGSPILDSDDFVTAADELLYDNIHIHFWKKSIRNKPEFDGRFFVKILTDDIIEDYLLKPSENITTGHLSLRSAMSLYSISDTGSDVLDQEGDNFNYSSGGSSTTASSNSTLNSRAEWRDRLKFGGSTVTGKWFVDAAPFASLQEGNLDSAGKIPHASGKTRSSQIWKTKRVFTNADNPNMTSTVNSFDSTSTNSHTTSHWCGYIAGTQTHSYSSHPSSHPWSGDKFGDGMSNSKIGMKGAWSSGTDDFLDISYSQHGPKGSTGNNDNHKLDWRIGEDGNTATDQEYAIVGALKPNQRFRIVGSEIVYKIKSVKRFRLFNYRGAVTLSPLYRGPHTLSYGWLDVDCDGDWSNSAVNQKNEMGEASNRRTTFRVKYEIDEENSVDGSYTVGDNITDDSQYTALLNNPNTSTNIEINFLDQYKIEEQVEISANPAIFETEPKEDVDLDIYYEASSSIPVFPLTNSNKHLFIPIGTTIIPPPNTPPYAGDIFVVGWSALSLGNPDTIIYLSSPLSTVEFDALTDAGVVYFQKDNGEQVAATPVEEYIDSDSTSTTFGEIIGIKIEPKNEVGLSWFNCWSFSNGVESNRIGDTYNKPFITNGATVSSILEKEYKEEHRKYGLIYSGIYNSTSGINNLNQFIAAEKITKDINPVYGSIQKLYSRSTADGDLITLCEDRVLKILANKDALFNADGNTQLTATENVLGQTIPYAGEFGISKNPESFAAESYRVYFTDKIRGTVMRLSKDGLTPISNYGMKDYFRDNLKLGSKLTGSYDDKKDEYNINIKGDNIDKTLTFREDVKGWVSFKSFLPEYAISCANEYYTFKNGKVYLHHANDSRNTFYDQPPHHSSVSVIFNEIPGSVKSFKTINYEGSQAKVTTPLNDSGDTIEDGEYFNLTEEDGWYVNSFITNLENGSVTEFIEKEGKWFGYIVGSEISLHSTSGAVTGNYDSSDFSIQGIGRLTGNSSGTIYGCTNNSIDTYTDKNGNVVQYNVMTNYNALAQVDDGSCIPTVLGCMVSYMDNYSAAANTDDGSCYRAGCMTVGSLNYDPLATIDDMSCTAVNAGCQITTMFNYAPTSNIACGGVYLAPGDGPSGNNLSTPQPANYCCYPIIYGCLDHNADNFITTVSDPQQDVNTDDGSCIYLGCTNPLATNYDFDGSNPPVDGTLGLYSYLDGTATDDGSCLLTTGCMDNGMNPVSYANNQGGTGSAFTNFAACNYSGSAVVDDGSCEYCADNTAENQDTNYVNVNCNGGCEYCDDVFVTNLMAISTTDSDVINGVDQLTGTALITFNETVWPSGTNYVNDYAVSYGGPGGGFILDNSNSTGLGTGTVQFTIDGLPMGTTTIEIIHFCGTYDTLGNSNNPTLSFFVNQVPVPGCTDNTGAANTATTPNGILGGWGACNYDQFATVDDGSCEYDTCAGCTNQLYTEYFGTNGTGGNIDIIQPGSSEAVTVGYCATPINGGCTDPAAFNYDASFNADCNDDVGGSDTGCCVAVVLGCTDATANNDGTNAASNYDPAANTDDGSCAPYNCPVVSYSMSSSWYETYIDFTSTPYDPNTISFTVNVNTSSLGNAYTLDQNDFTVSGYTMSYGNLYNTSGFYNLFSPGVTTLDITTDFVFPTFSSCNITDLNTYSVGCKQPSADNYDPSLDMSDTSQCVWVGCTDTTQNADGSGDAATNFDAFHNVECGGNNSCCNYGTNVSFQLFSNESFAGAATSGSRLTPVWMNNSTALNKNIVAILKLGGTTISNSPPVNGWFPQLNLTGYYADASNLFLSAAEWAPYVYTSSNELHVSTTTAWRGDLDNNSSLNDLLAHQQTETQQFTVGCKLSGANTYVNYDPNVDLHLHSMCVLQVNGCTDPTADNYNASANNDDGTCCYACNTPTWQLPSSVAITNLSFNSADTHVDSWQLNWNVASLGEANVANYIFNWVNVSDSTNTGSATIPIWMTTLNGTERSFTFNPGAANINDAPLKGQTYTVFVSANCTNDNGVNCSSSLLTSVNKEMI